MNKHYLCNVLIAVAPAQQCGFSACETELWLLVWFVSRIILVHLPYSQTHDRYMKLVNGEKSENTWHLAILSNKVDN